MSLETSEDLPSTARRILCNLIPILDKAILMAALSSLCTQTGGSVPSMQEGVCFFSSPHGPSQAATGHGKPSRGEVIPGMSHPDESDVSLLFFQAVGFFVTETMLFLLQPDLEALCTLRKEALLCCVR